MADESPRVGAVSFRGVGNRLPKPAPKATVASTSPTPADSPEPERADPPAPTPPTPVESAPSRTPTQRRPQTSPRPARRRTAPPENDGEETPPIPRKRTGTGQLPVRLPLELIAWVRQQDMTQRGLLLQALVEHGDSVPPSTDPVVLSRKRLGLPVRPQQRRRGAAGMINFSLTGEEKDLIEAHAAERCLSMTEFVTELLRRAQGQAGTAS